MNIHIVTDSCAHFTTPHFLQQYPSVTVVPNRLTFAGKTYREGIDLPLEEALRQIGSQPYAPVIASPSEDDFIEAFTRAARGADAIISIHASREMFKSYEHGLAAARQLSGHCPIVVIDSQTLCAAQGILVRVAADAAATDATLDDIVRLVRGAIERVYTIFSVENIPYLLQNKLMTASRSALSTMLGIKPFLSVEHGQLTVMEKVRTRAQAVDRLVEFVVEFADIDEVVILQHKSHITEQTRMIQDRLAVEFPGQFVPFMMYGTTMAALIGLDATGVVVFEKEFEPVDDDDF